MIKDIQIGNFTVGTGRMPFIVAEMSGNHNQSLERAMEIVEAAAKTGAHALKLQTYTADTMTLDLEGGDFYINDKNSLWKGQSLHKLYQQAYTPWEWHAPIFKKCKELGMLCFSTPFDESAVDFLETFDVPCYKIASFENTCIPLIKKVAKTGRPIIMSTGMATVGELAESVDCLKSNGAKDIILLKCTSTYPATPENSHISTIPHMRDLFDVHVGLSDHTMGCGVAVASTALGAVMIEKHFTLSRADGGVDASFSMEPAEFVTLVEESKKAVLGMGKVHYGISSSQEDKSKIFRRSVYIAENVKKGEVFNSKNLRCVRPGFGLPTKHYENLLGKRASRNLERGSPMKLEYVLDEE